MYKFAALVLLLSATFAVSTHAQDTGGWIDPSASMMSGTSAYDWTGLYAGGNIGYGFGTVATTASGNPQNDLRGFSGGAELGFNLDLGGLVVGAEVDGQVSNLGYSQTSGGAIISAYSMDYFGSARGRVGFAYNQFLPYVTAGVVGGLGTGKFTAMGGTFSQYNLHTGWTAGAGLEYAAADNMTLKLEYLYTDLGSKTYFAGFGTPVDVTFRFGTIRLGANFQF